MRNCVLERLILIKYHKLEVGRFHSLAFLKLLLSEFSIFLTCFSVLERAVSVDIEIITVGIVKIVIFNTLSGWIFELVERKIGIKLRISVQSLISHQWSFTGVLLTVKASFL